MVSPQSHYPPGLTEAEVLDLARIASDWATTNGLTVRPPANVVSDTLIRDNAAIHVPVTLFPSPFPRRCFDQARGVQEAYNRLYASVSQDEGFLAGMVKEVAGGDEFISNLWTVHLRVKNEGYIQPLSLGLFRSDYMVHQVAGEEPRVKQVEFNTIASSFGGLSSQTTQFHKYLWNTQYFRLQNHVPPGQPDLPENEATEGLAAGIRAAFHAYPDSDAGHKKCVVFLTQSGERNVFDQRHLEYKVQQDGDHAISVFHLAFADITKHTEISDTPRRQLLYHPPSHPAAAFEVAVVYFRSGYGPSDYPDHSAWDARYRIERSAAIKCPSVLTQLSGAKKVQQVLATPRAVGPSESSSVLGRFVPEGTEDHGRLIATFTNIFPLDTSDAGLEARRRALDPELCKTYVLKPQREGGGNNIYRSAIPGYLRSIPEDHWASFILMELITPPPVHNTILRAGKLEQGGVICELGIYGTCLWNQESGEILHNAQAGYLLRTKGDQSEEGGVAAGFGCMDSCYLV